LLVLEVLKAGGLAVHLKNLSVFALIAFVLAGTAVACWDTVDAHKTVVYDQIYAQARAQSLHSRYIAKVIARKYGRELAAAFKAEPECDGLNFSIQANKRLLGHPGRWNLDVDMVVNEQPDATGPVQPWSLVLPNRDGGYGPDTQVMSDTGEPKAIVRKVCEVVKSTGV
jgi:hypothetical protein